MPPTSRIAPLLQPYARLPNHESILLLTSVLGASLNWLLIRFLCEALQQSTENKDEQYAVILVSWLRDWEFWKSEGRKGGALDLQRLVGEKRMAFVDGLSELYLPQESGRDAARSSPSLSGSSNVTLAQFSQTSLPMRAPLGRVPPRTPVSAGPGQGTASSIATSSTAIAMEGKYTLTSPTLKTLESTIQRAISHLTSTSPASNKILLILDNPDALLAMEPSLTPSSLCSTILQLHTQTTHVLVHLSADDALIALSTPPQPLEIEGHNLLVKMAHMSSRVLSSRILDTGVARDVSGVLRVTGGGASRGNALDLDSKGTNGEEQQGTELLYLVKGDGSVKVFERGAGET